jgi:hypothetical protein
MSYEFFAILYKARVFVVRLYYRYFAAAGLRDIELYYTLRGLFSNTLKGVKAPF